VALQSPPPTSGLPALPPEQIAGVNDLAVQISRAASDADSASKSGYRFVGRWAQDANPVTAESRLWYTYQGFTNDGRYLVSFWHPVTTASLPKQAELTAAELDQFNADPQAYIQAQAETLNALPPSDWQPDLTHLDALVGSLRIDGMTATGLQGPAWQWAGTSWYELTESGHVQKLNPIADPAQYEVVYGTNGTLQVKADCNRASDTYTYDGGMVGSVRVQMGPMTLAECGPDSPLARADQQPDGRAGLPGAAGWKRAAPQHARRRPGGALPGSSTRRFIVGLGIPSLLVLESLPEALSSSARFRRAPCPTLQNCRTFGGPSSAARALWGTWSAAPAYGSTSSAAWIAP
jgi:heat shock protein HslJ